MKEGWELHYGNEVTDPLLELRQYTLKALDQIKINLGSISNYLASVHHMSIYDMSSNRYRLYNMYCSRKDINNVSSIMNKLGNILNIEIDISNIASEVIITIINNEANDFQIRNLQSIIKQTY